MKICGERCKDKERSSGGRYFIQVNASFTTCAPKSVVDELGVNYGCIAMSSQVTRLSGTKAPVRVILAAYVDTGCILLE